MAAWTTQHCDLNGHALSDVTAIASSRAFAFRLNNSQRLSFNVPGDDELIAFPHDDGYPLLSSGRRIVKAYRNELQDDGTARNVLRYLGLVWAVQDSGDSEKATCGVSCVDLFGARLNRRLCRDGRTPSLPRSVAFTSTDGTQIAKTLIERTNAIAPTGITTSGGTFDATPQRTVTYGFRYVGDAIVELATAFNGFDFELEPLDRTDGTLARFHGRARRGSVKSNVIFAWQIDPRTALKLDRLESMETFANSVNGIGGADAAGGQLYSLKESAPSITDLGLYETADNFTDITAQSFLDAVTSDELAVRDIQRELVQFLPQAGLAAAPFDDFDLGDLVQVYAGEGMRGGFAGYQRVYGFDLVVDDEGREIVNGVYAQQDG